MLTTPSINNQLKKNKIMTNEDIKEIVRARIDIAVERVFAGKNLLSVFVDRLAKLEDPNKSMDRFQIAGNAIHNLNFLMKEEKPENDKERVLNYEKVLSLTEDVLRLLWHLQSICQSDEAAQEAIKERLKLYESIKTMYTAFLNEYPVEVKDAWKWVAKCRDEAQKVRDDLHQLIGMIYKQEKFADEEAAYMLERTEKYLDGLKYHLQKVDAKENENVYWALAQMRIFYERAKLMQEAVKKDIEKEMRANGTW